MTAAACPLLTPNGPRIGTWGQLLNQRIPIPEMHQLRDQGRRDPRRIAGAGIDPLPCRLASAGPGSTRLSKEIQRVRQRAEPARLAMARD